jgi:hypothetical protein
VEVLPAHLIKLILEQPKGTELGKVPLLLIELPDTKGDLASALHESTKRDRLVTSETTGVTTIGKMAPPSSDSRVRAARTRRARAWDAGLLRKHLATAPHFATMLLKRDAHSVASRINVGRSVKADISLRDPSVSSFHAWLDCDEDGLYFVTDNSSRNGTWLEGKALVENAPSDVYPGDRIVFGKVKTILCSLADLRGALA